MTTEKLDIHFDSSEPIYIQIKNEIKKKAINKEWEPGHRIPSEEKLVSDLDVSRGTLRKAVTMLVEEGVLEKIQGKGTFVPKEKISYPFAQELISYEESMKNKGLNFETDVLEQNTGNADNQIQKELKLDDNSNVLYLKRVRSVEKEPAILLYNWVSLSRCPNLDKANFVSNGLFDSIEKIANVKIKFGVRNFSADIVTKEEAKLLNLKANSPILCINQTTYNSISEPIECSRVLLRTDQYQVTSLLYR
ncbi:MAG: GntR family transcriptional regulator [Tetragenococcus koreensis]|nr:GntR family transcriptional regulator [Tetragenococcus koreensis]MDN6749878.1 GntR family transcriptional regulator [Staphylococcus equorum]MDN6146186.1 GntR family transcriptional regulator [Tetragenococcus koreensis]MDN6266631.1 GntR family transcriptional regulator [Tetragenococcus koreensis]MDN6579663.1 GntR family transcriptional regulator [Tetragenococcus koreensis]